MRSRMIAAAAAAVVGLSVAGVARAAVLASENFNSYNTSGGNVNLSGLNGGSGFSGGWAVGAPGQGFLNEVRTASPLGYPNYVSPNDGNYANLASGYGGPSFNYAQRTVDVVGAFSAYNDGTRVGADGTTLYGSFLYNNTAGGQLYLQGATNHVFTLPTTGSDSLYVFKLAFGAGNADTFKVYSNPDLTTFDINTATPTSTSSGDFSFQTLVFVAPSSTNEVRFDKIVLGSNIGDVIPVPEPASLGLLGAMSLGLLRRRRA